MADSKSFDMFSPLRVAWRRVVKDRALFCFPPPSPQTVHRQYVIAEAFHV